MKEEATHELSPSELKLIRKLDRKDREIRILKVISAHINSSLDLDVMLKALLEQLDQFF